MMSCCPARMDNSESGWYGLFLLHIVNISIYEYHLVWQPGLGVYLCLWPFLYLYWFRFFVLLHVKLFSMKSLLMGTARIRLGLIHDIHEIIKKDSSNNASLRKTLRIDQWTKRNYKENSFVYDTAD